MTDEVDIYSFLRLFANKQNSHEVLFADFCEYMQKYAKHYLESRPELIVYVEKPQEAVQAELQPLEAQKKVIVKTDAHSRRILILPCFFLDKLTARYRAMQDQVEQPYPGEADIDANVASYITENINVCSDFAKLFDADHTLADKIYKLSFPDPFTPIYAPASFVPNKMLLIAASKIRSFFLKNDFKDFILKKIIIANPGKEISMRNFMSQLLSDPSESVNGIQRSGEAYAFWNCAANFARQDILKKNEYTVPEVDCIQSLYYIEYACNYFKTTMQQNLQRETALKNLDLALKKHPYYYTMEDIAKFTDSRGVPLLGQYSKEDLEQYLRKAVTSGSADSLSPLVSVQLENGVRYFMFKDKVTLIVTRLCGDCRLPVKKALTDEWTAVLKNYSQDKSMKEQREFEKKLETLVAAQCPLLSAIINSPFLPLLSFEGGSGMEETPETRHIFIRGQIAPYSVLLDLNRTALLNDAKILLPFWYAVPILSAIIAFFKAPKKKTKPQKKKNAPPTRENPAEEQMTKPEKREALRKAAQSAERQYVREGSTLAQDLSYYLDRWNQNLNKTAKDNLTEDVNSLVRDYLRKTLRSLPAAAFTLERIQNLAETLAGSPALKKIKNGEALLSYIICYMIQLTVKL